MKSTIDAVVDSAQELAHNVGLAHSHDDAPTETAPDALVIIKDDHERVAALFARALAADTVVTKMRPVVAEIVRELETHAKMEETIFYPALQKRTKAADDDRQRVLEAYEEHGTLKDLIKKIKKSTGRDESLRAKVQVLKELVEHHVREEEHAMFAEAHRLLGETRLRALGVEMVAYKNRGKRAKPSRDGGRPTKAATRAKPDAKATGSAKRRGAKKR